MKANEFVKKFGIREAKIALMYCKSTSCGTVFYKNIQVDAEDLKRLVVSHDFVGSYGGLESSKLTVNYPKFLNDEDIKTTSYRLSKAIADVESCM